MKWLARGLALVVLLILAAAGWLWSVNFRDGVDVAAAATVPADAAALQHGAYLARVGNCLACHTARGGAPGAGGLAIRTGFGTAFSANLTPDDATGIGRWNANTFWRAVHFGRGADGRLLIPIFPYTHSTLMPRADVDALFAYFKSLPPTRAARPAPELRWPYGTQLALAVWRALYFTPGSYVADTRHDATWNRGAYLVRGVAHCSVCHATRDALGGADWNSLTGGVISGQGWYAPSLVDPREAGVADWPEDEIGQLLRTGVAPHGRANGPMAETVMRGTQYLSDTDVHAMSTYLKSLPQVASVASAGTAPAAFPVGALQAGQKLYEKNCASCHGMQGEGVGVAYPALARNRAVTMPAVDNLLRLVLMGGFNAATKGYPRPFGMPPFALQLTDDEIASVLSYIRTAWGNDASAVSAFQVHALRVLADPDPGKR